MAEPEMIFPAVSPAGNYELFYRTYAPRVQAYLRNKCPVSADAEELASQVFEYCYNNRERFDPSKASAATWVFMIARSRLISYYRGRREHVNIDEVENCLSAGDPTEQATRQQAIREEIARALQSLDERQRRAVVMRYIRGRSFEEIAAGLDMTPGNVRVMLSRAMKKMRETVDPSLIAE